MKIYCSLFIILLICISCKKASTTQNLDSIIGKWFQKKSVSTFYQNGKRGSDDVDTNFSSSDFLEFKSSGEVLNGNGVKSTYILSDKILTFTNTGSTPEKQQFKILTLTASQLVISWDYDIELKNGVEVYKESTELTFSKSK